MDYGCSLALETPIQLWTLSVHYEKQSLSTLETVSYCLVAPMSVLAGCLLLAQFYLRPELRHPPGELILWQLLSQFCMDLTWMSAGGMYIFLGRVEDNTFCVALGIASLYSIFVSCGYGIALTVEVFYKIKKPLNLSFGTRVAAYHFFAHLQAFLITLTAAASSALGLTSIHSCFFEMGDWQQMTWLTMLPLALFFGYLLLSVFLLLYLLLRAATARKVGVKSILWNHYIFASASLLISSAFPGYLAPYVWYWATDNSWVAHASNVESIAEVWSKVGCIVGPAAGLLLCALQTAIHFTYQPKQKSSRQLSSNSAPTCESPLLSETIPRLYDNMLQECVMSTLLSLFLLFRQKDKDVRASSSTESGSTSDEGKAKAYWKFGKAAIDVGGTPFLEDAKAWFRVTIKEYNPSLYAEVRELMGVKEEELAFSFHPLLNESTLCSNSGNKGGKSNAFIYFTHDRRFILKTLQGSEVHFLAKHQAEFNQHFKQRSDGFSFIAKILGIYKLSDHSGGAFLAIMENIIPGQVIVSALFDLKGSKKNRSSLDGKQVTNSADLSRKKVYKDLDFTQVMHQVALTPAVFQHFHLQLTSDVAFLEKLKVMDYSLLLAFTETARTAEMRELESADRKWRMYAGIIDYLQRFNSRKKLEVLSYRLKRPHSDPLENSCVNHHLYADRFLHFLASILPASQ